MSFLAGKAAFGLSCCCFLGFFLCPSVGACGIILEPHVGFHGLFQLGHPFPLEIELANSGRPVEGSLEVKVWKGGPSRGGTVYPFYYRRTLFLAAQSRKSIQFTIDPDFISRPLTVTFSGPGVRLSREIDLRGYFSPAPLLLLLGEGGAAPSIPRGPTSSGRLVALSLAELPSDPRALLGVSTVIFYEQSLRDLSRLQTLALDSWLTSGGSLLILGSLNYALYQEPTISRFLPVRVVGVKKFSSLKGLRRSYGERAAAVGPVWAQLSRPVGGKVLWEEQGTPILVEMVRGRGKISYLSLDVGRPPLSRWDGLPELFRDLLASAPSGGPPLRTTWDDAVFSQLLLDPSFLSAYVPTGSLLLAMLLYLGGVGWLAWLWHGRRFARRRLAFSLVSFVSLSALGGHIYFRRGGHIPDAVLFSATLLESIPNGYVEGQSNVALFSTQARRYDVGVERGWSDWTPVLVRSKEREESAFSIEQDAGSSRFQFPLRAWDYKLFQVRFVDRFPLRADIERRGDKILLILNHQAAKDLTDCWLVAAGQRFFLGDIPRGSSWTREFPLAGGDRAANASKSTGLGDISFNNKARDVLFRRSFFPQEKDAGRWGHGVAIFFGWVKQPERRVRVDDGRIQPYDHALFRAVVALEEEPDL